MVTEEATVVAVGLEVATEEVVMVAAAAEAAVSS